jgi:hypothetical protein
MIITVFGHVLQADRVLQMKLQAYKWQGLLRIKAAWQRVGLTFLLIQPVTCSAIHSPISACVA